jgi:hypothetical protein
MSDQNNIKEEKPTQPKDPNKKPLPAIEGETVVEKDLDDVAGGMLHWCVTTCGAVTA